MSGFFFCGIKLDPVENDSLNSTKPNSLVLQMIKSSLKRERCIPIMVRQKRDSHTKSRSLTASMLFWLACHKPSSRARNSLAHRQPTDALRVTVVDTYFASDSGNFRTSTMIF